ncbi:hypothetical protein J1N35_014720, partial [Gossypium stocksii]
MVGILTLNYETFTMKPEEDMKAMSDRSSSMSLNSMGRPILMKNDEDSSDNEDQEVANPCLTAIDNFGETFNSSNSNSYSFNKLQNTYDELGLLFESIVPKYKETISKLKDENDLFSKAIRELERKIHNMQTTINDFEKKNQDLHNLLSK